MSNGRSLPLKRDCAGADSAVPPRDSERREEGSMPKRRVAILISGRGANMSALIEAAKKPCYPAEITLVISNRPDAAGLQRATSEKIATAVVDHTQFGKDREQFERAVQAVLEVNRVEIICLAGFLRVFTPWFVSRWNGRMINIHPALLPSFKGLNTHARALEAGVKIHGATVHFVVPEMDSGPAIAQGALAVRDDDTAESLAARVLAIEHKIYPLALRLVAEGRVRIENGRCRIDGARNSDTVLLVPDADG
jgi:phosphoribosylglycinamide formyltransferase 1